MRVTSSQARALALRVDGQSGAFVLAIFAEIHARETGQSRLPRRHLAGLGHGLTRSMLRTATARLISSGVLKEDGEDVILDLGLATSQPSLDHISAKPQPQVSQVLATSRPNLSQTLATSSPPALNSSEGLHPIPGFVALPKRAHESQTSVHTPAESEPIVETFPHDWKPRRQHQERAMADWGMPATEVIRCWMDCRHKPFSKPNTPTRHFHRCLDWWAKDKGLTPRLLAKGAPR